MNASVANPSAARAGTGPAAFERFVAGEAVSGRDVEEAVAACVPGAVVEACRFGFWRKAMARIRDGDGALRYAKVAFHPFAAGLLEAEAAGYLAAGSIDAFELPDHSCRRLSDDLAVATTTALDGTAPPARAALRRPRPPFAASADPPAGVAGLVRDLGARLSGNDSPEARRATGLLDRLSDGHGHRRVALAPSHGDFVYWNTLERPGRRPVLLDFEYYAPRRVAGFDAVYWRMLPLLRLSVRKGLPPGADRVLRRAMAAPKAGAAGDIAGEAHLALCLLEHATRMISEHALADVDALIGSGARTLREGIVARQLALADGLIG